MLPEPTVTGVRVPPCRTPLGCLYRAGAGVASSQTLHLRPNRTFLVAQEGGLAPVSQPHGARRYSRARGALFGREMGA